MPTGRICERTSKTCSAVSTAVPTGEPFSQGVHTEARRAAAAARHRHAGGQDPPAGGGGGAERRVRGGFSRFLLRVPVGAQAPRCAGCAGGRDFREKGELDACGFFGKEQAGTLKPNDIYLFRVAAMLGEYAAHGAVLRRYNRSVSKLDGRRRGGRPVPGAPALGWALGLDRAGLRDAGRGVRRVHRHARRAGLL